VAQRRWPWPGLQLGPYTTWRVGAVQHLPSAEVHLHEQLHLLAAIPLQIMAVCIHPCSCSDVWLCNWHSMQL
jgi:hypothetical protein